MFRLTSKTVNLTLKRASISFLQENHGALRCLSRFNQSTKPNENHANDEQNREHGDSRSEARSKWSGLMVGGGALLAGAAIWGMKNDEVSESAKKLLNVFSSKATVHASSSVKTDLPESVTYLLIGGGLASYSAAKVFKEKSPKSKVLIVTEEADPPYMRPPLSKNLWAEKDGSNLRFGTGPGKDMSIFLEDRADYASPADLKSRSGVAISYKKRVVKLDIPNNTAILDDGSEVKYERCLIATGGKPKNIAVFKNADPKVQERVSTFRGVPDFLELDKITKNVKSVAVIGGGFLGSELACAMAKRVKVTQLFPGTGIFARVLPDYLSEWTTEKVRLEGVDIKESTNATSAAFKNGQVELRLDNGYTQLVDHVVVCTGLEPNTEIAKSSGLEVDSNNGGIKVNAELQARTNVYVAGDVSSFYDTELGRRRVEHHDHAKITGSLAAENMMGAAKPYTDQSMFWSSLGKALGFQAVGKIDSKLATLGVYSPSAEGQLVVVKETEKYVERFPWAGDRKKKRFGWFGSKKSEPVNLNDFKKGVIFYLDDNKVVGVVTWNIYNKLGEAREIMKQGTKPKDIKAIAKQFGLE